MNHHRPFIAFAAIYLLSIGLFLEIASKQASAQTTQATISGTITDASGAAVASATIEVKNTGTGFTRSLMSDAEGRYTINNLPIGEYEVTGSRPGFQTVVRKGITLTIGSQNLVDFALQVGQQQQTVTVEGQVSQVETASSSVSSLVDTRQIRELPLNGRNIEQLILLAPGVQSINMSQTSSFNGRNITYSVSGSRGEGQAFLLDNQDMQNFWGKGIGAGAIGTSLGVDAIAEFQTLTNTYSAQFGGAGAAVNSVSKSGTNQLHGSLFEFVRNSAFDARNFFDGTSLPPFRRNQFGGSLGGPVKKDKAFFFANYEGFRQSLTVNRVAQVPRLDNRTITATNPAVRQRVQDTLALYPAPTTFTTAGFGTALTTGTQVAHENYLLTRGDITLSDKDNLFMRYLSDRADYLDPYPSPGAQLNLWNESTLTRNHFATVEERRIISSALVNALRLSFSRPGTSGATLNSIAALQFHPVSGGAYVPFQDRQNGNVAIPGIAALGPNSTTPFVMVQSKYIIGDDLFWTKGAHSLKFGASVLYNQTNAQNSFQGGSNWTFNSYPDFLAGNATLLTGVLPNSIFPGQYFNRDTRSTEYSPYVHDEWKVRSNLTINLGLRYTFQTNPTERHGQLYGFLNPPFFAPAGVPNIAGIPHIDNVWVNGNPSKYNFDPRIGFAYDPFSDHKTSIRGGFGIFHNVLEARTYMPGTWNAPPQVFGSQVNPTYGVLFSSITATPIRINPGLDNTISRTPYMIQWNFNVQHDFAGNILTAGYIGSSGVDLINIVDVNAPIPTTGPDGRPRFGSLQVLNGRPTVVAFPRPNTGAAALGLNEARGHSSYNALQIGLNRRLARGVQSQVSYAWSHCIDNGSISTGLEASASANGPQGYQNPYNQNADRGNCAFDIRHTLRVNGVWTLPLHGNMLFEGWQLSGILSATGGYPLTVSSGFDQVGFQGPVRPDAVVGCGGGEQILGTVRQWFNPNCFALPPIGAPGNLGRTTFTGPHLTNVDFSLVKDTRISKISESFDVQFRAEFFNILNHANFGLPNTNAFVQQVNTATGSITAAGNGAFGSITTTAANARQIQLGLRVIF